MKITTHTWPGSTRPCDFCLCLQDGCVFADFGIDESGSVHLVRISFDGYGCCRTEGHIDKMSLEDSHTLLEFVRADDVERKEVREILFRYFDSNKNVIWEDALTEHELLRAPR